MLIYGLKLSIEQMYAAETCFVRAVNKGHYHDELLAGTLLEEAGQKVAESRDVPRIKVAGSPAKAPCSVSKLIFLLVSQKIFCVLGCEVALELHGRYVALFHNGLLASLTSLAVTPRNF